MRNHHIDEKDRKLMNMLMKNARTSYTDLAKAVELKSPTVIDRVKRLESDEIIEGYHARINYKRLGYDILAFIGVWVDNAVHIEEFERGLSELDEEIIECHHVTGDYTMILKVVTKNTESLSRLIKVLRNLPGVDKTNTILVFNTIMERDRPL